MDKQQIFDKVAKHLLTQNKKSVTKDGMCYYRHPTDNLRCAIGCLIPNDVYEPSMEKKTVLQLLARYPDLRQIFGVDICLDLKSASFLTCLQDIHDNFEPKDWRDMLKHFAAKHNLSANILD